MESRITYFAVFAIVVQSSLAGKENAFFGELAEIKLRGIRTLEPFYALVDGFFDTMYLLVNRSSRNQGYDAEIVNQTESMKEVLVADLIESWHETEAGLRFITRNVSALANAEDIKLRELVELVFSPFHDIIRGKSYSECAVAVNTAEEIAMPKVIASWMRIYNIIGSSISSRDLTLNNALKVITAKQITNGIGAFRAIFAGFKIFLLELFGETQAGGGTFSSAMETERNFARMFLTDEVHTKFTFFQYVATVRYLKDDTIMADLNQIQVAELSINNLFEYACESAFTAIIELSEGKDPSCGIENLSAKLFASLYPAVLNGEVTSSSMQPEGSSYVGIDQTAVYNGLQIVSDGITNAIKLTQESNACGVHDGIEITEKRVVTVATNVFRETFFALGNTASSIDHDAVATMRSYSTRSSAAIHAAFANVFSAIKILLFPGVFGPQPGYCDTGISGIKIARDGAFAGVKTRIVLQFDIIRIFRLFDYLRAKGIEVPFSILRPA